MAPRKRQLLSARNMANAWTVAQQVGKVYKNYKSTAKQYSNEKRNRPSAAGGGGTSFQHDSSVLYRRRKPNKRKSKAYKKFARKVYKVAEKARGKSTLIINGTFVVNSSQPFQMVSEVNLYSVNGSDQGANDQDIILNEASNFRKYIDEDGQVGRAYTNNEKFRDAAHMTSAKMDITYHNNGTTLLECDLYQIKHSNVRTNDLLHKMDSTSLLSEVPANITEASVSNGGEYQIPLQVYNPTSSTIVDMTQPFLATRGTTPFDFKGIMKTTGATILSKTKFQISPGNTITRQAHSLARKTIFPHATLPLYRYDKHTITWLMVAKSVDPTATGQSLRTSYTKHYRWTVEGHAEDKLGIVTQPAA